MSLAAYRSLFRAARVAFQGDERALMEAKNRIRHEFRTAPQADPTDSEYQKRIHYAQDVAAILRSNVVQGVPREDNKVFKLRIHEDTERGDNESIKLAGMGGGCGSCS